MRHLHQNALFVGKAADSGVLCGAARCYRLRGSLDVRSVRLASLLGAAWRSNHMQASQGVAHG